MDFLTFAIIRTFVPLIIFRFSLLGIFLSWHVDNIDWHNLAFNSTEDYKFYQVWDKILDIYYLAIAAFVSLFWKDKIARIISISSFFYRAIGVFLFIILDNRYFLFIFPNFFENFFVFYLVYKKITKNDQMFYSRKDVFLVILALLLPKMFQEYLYHVVQISLWQVIDIGKLLGLKGIIYESINKIAFITIYLSLPFTALIKLLKDKKN